MSSLLQSGQLEMAALSKLGPEKEDPLETKPSAGAKPAPSKPKHTHDGEFDRTDQHGDDEEDDDSELEDELNAKDDNEGGYARSKETTYCASPVARLPCSYYVSGAMLTFRYFTFTMALTILTLILHAAKFLSPDNSHDKAFEYIFLLMFIFFAAEIVVLSLVFEDFFLSFGFFADLIATMTLLIDIPLIWTPLFGLPELDLDGGSAGVLSTLRILDQRSTQRSAEAVLRYFRYFRIIKIFQTWARIRLNKRRRLRQIQRNQDRKAMEILKAEEAQAERRLKQVYDIDPQMKSMRDLQQSSTFERMGSLSRVLSVGSTSPNAPSTSLSNSTFGRESIKLRHTGNFRLETNDTDENKQSQTANDSLQLEDQQSPPNPGDPTLVASSLSSDPISPIVPGMTSVSLGHPKIVPAAEEQKQMQVVGYDKALLTRGAIGASDVGRLLNERTAIRMALLCVVCAMVLPHLEPVREASEMVRSAETLQQLVYTFPRDEGAIPSDQSISDYLAFLRDYYRQRNRILYYRIPQNDYTSQTYLFDEIDLSSVRRQELKYVGVGPLITTNDASEGPDPLTLPQVEIVYSLRNEVWNEHFFWLILTGILLVVLIVGGRLFAYQPNQLIVRPLEEMMSSVLELQKDPISATEKGKQMWKKRGRQNINKLNEVEQLHVSLYQFAEMIQRVFGRAGSRIITAALSTGRFNPIISGKRVFSIFSFSDIRQFTDATECLREEVMDYVNSIAIIVHEEAEQAGGSPNKNVGDAFLLVWELEAAQRRASKWLAKLGRSEDGKLQDPFSLEPEMAELEQEFGINVKTILDYIRLPLLKAPKRLVMTSELINPPQSGPHPSALNAFTGRGSGSLDIHGAGHRRSASGARVSAGTPPPRLSASLQLAAHESPSRALSPTPPVRGLTPDPFRALMIRSLSTLPTPHRGEDPTGVVEVTVTPEHNTATQTQIEQGEKLLTWYDSLNDGDRMCFDRIREEITNLADQAFFCTVRTCLAIQTDPNVASFANLKKIQERHKDFKVKLGFGLHAGESVEGPIGSSHKVDASYLSPEVNLAETLESQTKDYGARLLMSGEFVSLLSPNVVRLCRPVDLLIVPGRDEPLEVWTFDCHDVCLEWLILDNPQKRAQYVQLLLFRSQFLNRPEEEQTDATLIRLLRDTLIKSLYLDSDDHPDYQMILDAVIYELVQGGPPPEDDKESRLSVHQPKEGDATPFESTSLMHLVRRSSLALSNMINQLSAQATQTLAVDLPIAFIPKGGAHLDIDNQDSDSDAADRLECALPPCSKPDLADVRFDTLPNTSEPDNHMSVSGDEWKSTNVSAAPELRLTRPTLPPISAQGNASVAVTSSTGKTQGGLAESGTLTTSSTMPNFSSTTTTQMISSQSSRGRASTVGGGSGIARQIAPTLNKTAGRSKHPPNVVERKESALVSQIIGAAVDGQAQMQPQPTRNSQEEDEDEEEDDDRRRAASTESSADQEAEGGVCGMLRRFLSLRPTMLDITANPNARSPNQQQQQRTPNQTRRGSMGNWKAFLDDYKPLGMPREKAKDLEAGIGYFVEDKPLTELTKGYSRAFRYHHLQGMRAYVLGQWDVARACFESALACLHKPFEDKATKRVLEYIKSHNYQCPPGWRGRPIE